MAPPRRRIILLSAGLILAIALTFVFGYRAGRQARRFRWESQPVHGWMSIPFIAHTHHVSSDVLYHAIGATPQTRDHRPLRRIARDQKRPVEQLIQEVTAALESNGVRMPAPAPEHKTP